ncbi:protein of unknown function (plasmid) [Cupriavidus taiwanensis]|uniref:Uncharacterized protein n=1 Tax=Cupriavidus taiwanensis TaxID=164546 RepID=A0A9Q7UZW0_9BURK|nr:protein of unknown function [Cupriavidus taiwanensis]
MALSDPTRRPMQPFCLPELMR